MAEPKIGVVQRSDAALDPSWHNMSREMDGIVLFTRNPDRDFSFRSRNLVQVPCIVHIRLSGWEKSKLEPNGMDLESKLAWTVRYLRDGFDGARLVLDFDPVIPDARGISRLSAALKACEKAGLLPGTRVRLHVLKQYGCVERHAERVLNKTPYPKYQIFPDDAMLRRLAKALRGKPYPFETCACDGLCALDEDKFVRRSCVSPLDLKLMGLDGTAGGTYVRPQPDGCRCLPKIEMSSGPCPNQCVTCPFKQNHPPEGRKV